VSGGVPIILNMPKNLVGVVVATTDTAKEDEAESSFSFSQGLLAMKYPSIPLGRRIIIFHYMKKYS